MSKEQLEKELTEGNGEGSVKIKKKKKLKHKKHKKMATNEQIIEYCINNNLMYALMTWLEIDLGIKILRSGIIKSFKTALGTDCYYFVSLDPNKRQFIKEMDMSITDYNDYKKSLYNEISVYLTESETKPASAKSIFGRYVYNKLNDRKTDDLDIEAFIRHIKYFKDSKLEEIKEGP